MRGLSRAAAKLGEMTTRRPSLLCELHAHTTLSDGDLTLRETVDLHGRSGFDVLCITDHCIRADDPWLTEPGPMFVHAGNFDGYLQAVEVEAERARALYGMLVLPGLELTYQNEDPRKAAHAVAVGLRRFVGVDDGIEAALIDARAAGAVVIAAHPYPLEVAPSAFRNTARFALDWQLLQPLVDRFELINRHDLFPWVAEARLPYVASGDFHRLEHLSTWKTLVPCDQDETALISYLRSAAPVHITRFTAGDVPAKLAA